MSHPFLLVVAFGAIMTAMSRPKSTNANPHIAALIRREARAQGVPEAVALATAQIESNFNPDAKGDLKWHKNAKRFESVVPKSNPHAWNRSLWHSYGLFQLLAPYHVRGAESPLVLLDPTVNAQRGTKFLRTLMTRHQGDLDAVRLAYVGLTSLDDPSAKQKVLKRWHTALAQFGYSEPRV